MTKPNLPISERIQMYTIPEPNSGCLLWIGALCHGYGELRVAGRPRLVHRLVWELKYSGIPKGMSVLHKCDNPPCVNVEHLFLGTQRDNCTDMTNKGRRRAGHGERSRAHRLSDKDVLAIRASWRGGVGVVALANRYGVWRNSISSIVHGRSRVRPTIGKETAWTP